MNDIEIAREAARRGAAALEQHFGQRLVSDLKGTVDPVTVADRAAEAAIVDFLRSERPTDSIVAEEGSGQDGSDRRWVIDPLDGTINFIHGIPHIAVSVGLEDGDGPLAGVVFDPIRREEFWAVRGGGAHLGNAPIAVSETASLKEAVIATGFPYDRDDHGAEYATVVGAVLHEALGLRRMGAAALDLAWVACGRFDAYWEWGLAPWDLLAGHLLVTEAGGHISDVAGASVNPGEVVATNGSIHESLRRILASHRPHHRGGPL